MNRIHVTNVIYLLVQVIPSFTGIVWLISKKKEQTTAAATTLVRDVRQYAHEFEEMCKVD